MSEGQHATRVYQCIKEGLRGSVLVQLRGKRKVPPFIELVHCDKHTCVSGPVETGILAPGFVYNKPGQVPSLRKWISGLIGQSSRGWCLGYLRRAGAACTLGEHTESSVPRGSQSAGTELPGPACLFTVHSALSSASPAASVNVAGAGACGRKREPEPRGPSVTGRV